nr:3-deoxy-D-arabino-heptulosonate 7-phosphate synthase [Paraburkholderia sp. J41]
MPAAALLAETLRLVTRRYGLPPFEAEADASHDARPATTLALTIEQARRALACNATPDDALRAVFVDALARLIGEALRTDTAFQAMLLRHRVAHVREFASLAAHAERDRRSIFANVNAIAHPARQARTADEAQRAALARVHASAASASWAQLREAARDLARIANDAGLRHGLERLVHNPALAHLERLAALSADAAVQQYQALWDCQGPRPGSADAVAQGSASQQRGAAVEALAAQALEALAARLEAEERASGIVSGSGHHEKHYRVVTSMRVPASIPASAERAKSEWDAVLLRRAPAANPAAAQDVWHVCLLVEAKASVDAATTDFPRLLRGLRLLAHANPDAAYAFETQQGAVRLAGASLHALSIDESAVRGTVLYCSDAPAEPAPRLLGAASRMQLLSAPASLAFASTAADGREPDARDLDAVWQELLASPRWAGVLNQYPLLDQVRGLMVHTDDLLAAIGAARAA